jgi:hypothetical protein
MYQISKNFELEIFRNLIHSPKTSLTFFTALIFANICSEGMKFWSISSIDFKSILKELVSNFHKK